MFKIDTGYTGPAAEYTRDPISAQVDDGQDITITTPAQLRKWFKLVSENLRSFHDEDELKEYWASENLLLDAIYLYCIQSYEELASIYAARLQTATHDNDPGPDDCGW